jgi:SAM-dependent methyltransferase
VTAYLAARGADVVGVDLSAGMVAEARRRNPGLRFEQGDMLDLGDRRWGAVVALYSLIHLERSRVPAALKQIHGALRAGGRLALAVHAGTGEIRHDSFMDHDVPFTGTFFERDEVATMVESAGFEIEQLVERDPYSEEGPTRRIYVIAAKNAQVAS